MSHYRMSTGRAQSSQSTRGLETARRGAVRGQPALHTLQRLLSNQAMLALAHAKERQAGAPSLIQTQLTVNQPGDRYEQEADHVADAVMRMPDPEAAEIDVSAAHDARIQRLCDTCQEEVEGGTLQRQPEDDPEEELLQAKAMPGAVPEVTPDVASQIRALQGGGTSMPTTMQRFFEPRFGYDFSGVRVHTGPRARG